MAINHTSLLLLLVLLVQSFASAPPILQHGDEDGVSLLQGQLEMKRNEAAEARTTSEKDRAASTTMQAEASCPSTFGDCGAEPEGSFKIRFPAQTGTEEGEPLVAEVSSEIKPGRGAMVGSSSPKHHVKDAEGQASPMALGTVLEVLACLLIVDMLRRWSWKAKGDKHAQESSASKASGGQTSSQHTGRNPLLVAALAGDSEAFEAQFPGNQSRLAQVDCWGCTPLHYAAKGGSAHIVCRLLDLGFKVDAIDAWDETPLHMSARAGCIEACASLLRAGANVNALNAQDYTPLVVAGQAGMRGVCSLLLDRGGGAGGLADEEVPGVVAALLMQRVLIGAPGQNGDGRH